MSLTDPDIDDLAAESDPVLEHEADGEQYAIRRFQQGDRAGFLELFDAVENLELGGSPAWFDWKFDDNPYLPHVPVFVAEHDGDIVGARPFVGFRLRAGPQSVVALQTADTMVHPNHRGRGVFSRMNDLAFAFYEQREPALMFSIPNDRSRPAYLDLGARSVGPIRSYHRLNRPSRFVGEKLSWMPGGTDQVLDTVAGGYLAVHDRTGPDGNGDISVERYSAVPSRVFAALARREDPDEIHAYRDEQFFDWRYENPHWEYDSYVAVQDGSAVAGMITGTRDTGDRQTTRICDAVPLAGNDRRPGIAALLARVLEDHRDSAVVAASGTTIPADLLEPFGFRPDDELPLSPFTHQTVLITMPLQSDRERGWELEGRDISAPASWQLPFCEHNTS